MGGRGAAVLSTPSYQLVGRDLDDLVQHFAMGVVYGAAGLGKTFAVQAAVERLAAEGRATGSRLRIVDVVFPHDPTTRRVAETLSQALLGRSGKPARGRFELQEQVRLELSSRPHLLVVDEAQRLTRHAMEVLRYFYDDPDIQLALLLVGGDGCWETISREPMLASRVYRRRRFHPFRAAEVPDLMRSYHDLYAHADPGLISDVNTVFAHGYWRDWAKFTSTVLDLALENGRDTLDEELTVNAYISLGCGDPDL